MAVRVVRRRMVVAKLWVELRWEKRSVYDVPPTPTPEVTMPESFECQGEKEWKWKGGIPMANPRPFPWSAANASPTMARVGI